MTGRLVRFAVVFIAVISASAFAHPQRVLRFIARHNSAGNP
jgi:hypothetical protein